MQAARRENMLNTTIKGKSKTNMTRAIIFLLSLLVLGRAFSDTFFYIFAAVSFVIVMVAPLTIDIPILFFLLPFDTILKTGIDGMSFFTVLFFLVALKMLCSQRFIEKSFLVSLLLLLVYCVIFSGLYQIKTIITIGGGLALLYCLRNSDVDTNSVIITYSLGICMSSLLVVFKSSMPIVKMFANDVMLKLGEDNYASRFSGLRGNPNYYTLDITMALAALVVVMAKEKPKPIFLVCFAALTAFGMMSVSKSFVFSWCVLILVWFAVSIRQGAGNTVKFIFILAIACAAIYFFAQDSVEAYMERFTSDSTGTASSITTGRSDIWLEYFKEIFADNKILFLGNGLNTMATIRKGAHNTYIEGLFTMGMIGSALYFVTIRKAMGRVLTKKIIWIPLGLLLFRMLAIGILVYDNLWFYLGLIIILSDYRDSNNVSVSYANRMLEL